MKIDRKKIEQAASDSNLGYSTSHYDSFIEGVEWTLAQVKNCSIPNVVGRSEQFTPKQLWKMAQKYNADDFIKMVKEIEG